jgi:hypothetical protein
MNWWRAYHGLPFDSKLGVVAKRCNARRGDVAAVWVAVLDFASQQEDRGAVSEIDPEEIAVSYDYDIEYVSQILKALEEKGMIAAGRLTAWERRQVQREREDDSIDRVRAYRQRQKKQAQGSETPMSRLVTPRNAPEQSRTEQSRTDKSSGGFYDSEATARCCSQRMQDFRGVQTIRMSRGTSGRGSLWGNRQRSGNGRGQR